MAALLKDAIKPNLVQTLEHTPALVHGGPFANIAHGCNSVRGHAAGPEAGGLCGDGGGLRRGSGRGEVPGHQVPHGGLSRPMRVVLVATVRALKYHGGVPEGGIGTPSVESLAERACVNLRRARGEYAEQSLACPVCVAHQRASPRTTAGGARLPARGAARDLGSALRAVRGVCQRRRGRAWSWPKMCVGMSGTAPPSALPIPTGMDVDEKLLAVIAQRYLRRKGRRVHARRPKNSLRNQKPAASAGCRCALPRRSTRFRTTPRLLGAPEGFTVTVHKVRLSAGAGFVVAYDGRAS